MIDSSEDLPLVEGRYWKEIAICKRCGRKYEVQHRLRKYCDECKKKLHK